MEYFDGSSGIMQRTRADGKALRDDVSRKAQGEWVVRKGREDAVTYLKEQAAQRLSYLVPERHLRMSASPFAFFRGSALLMASDLAEMPATGMHVQACGDAHIANFGAFAAPDRRLVFDINDFDETSPAPWEWDVKRLAASIEICGRDRGFDADWRSAAVRGAVKSYRRAMLSFSNMGALDVWYARLDVDEVLGDVRDKVKNKQMRAVHAKLTKATKKTSAQAFGKYIKVENGKLSIAFDPPYLVPLDRFASAADADRIAASLTQLLSAYRNSLAPELRHLFDQYEYLDAAQKVVGVGSVGTRSWIVAFSGREVADPLVLQVKEAQASVLERFNRPSGCSSQGERVVRGQRIMQAAGDLLLGYASAKDEQDLMRDYYIRQLWDWKTSTDLETADALEIEATAKMCGWTLARAHARSGNRFAIAGYLGSSAEFDRAMADFAVAYADQNEEDFRVFIDALSDGTLLGG